MRLKALLLSVVMMLSALSLQMITVGAAGYETVFEDDFSSDLGNWEDMINPNPSYARYSISSGVMRITTDKVNGGNRIYVKNAVDFGASDYEVSFRLSLNSWTEYTYVLFRADSLDTCYGLWYNAYGYEQAVSLVKNGTEKKHIMPGMAKNAVSAGFKTVGWNNIKINVQGNHISVYINNMDIPVFDVTDTDNPNMTGGIVFGTHTGQPIATGLSVDDVKVSAPGNVDNSIFGGYKVPGDAEGTSYAKAAKLLMDLHIMDTYVQEDNFKEQASVTRGELARIMTGALNLSDISETKEDVAEDVPSDHAYASYIAQALQNGILSSAEDGRFYPDRFVKYEEAVKCVVHTMGYGEIADHKGGYPDGYIRAAAELKLLSGIRSQKGYVISRGQLAVLVYNALHSEILKPVGVEQGSIVYHKDAETWLNYYFDIYDDTGVVEATENMAIRSVPLTNEGKVRIDGMIFGIGNSDADAYFGATVDYYYCEAEDETYIVSAVPREDCIAEINARDLVAYNHHVYSYYSGEKLQTAKVSLMADFFYNGRSMGTQEFYIPTHGSIRLVDTNGDGTYEVVIVTSYTTTVFLGYDTLENMILDKYDAKYNIPFKINGEDVQYSIINSKGKKLEPEKIPQGSLLSVAASADGKLVCIRVSTDKATGVVQAVSSDTVTVNRAEYRQSKVIRNADVLKPGANVDLLLDYMGEAACVSLTQSSGSFCYVIAAKESSNSLDKTVQVRFFNSSSGSIEVASCKDKTLIDGTKYSDRQTILKKITVESPAIISIKSGLITEIDYPYTDTPVIGESENTLKYLGGDSAGLLYFYNMMFGNKVAVTSETVMINVPQDGVTSDNEKLFGVGSPGKLSNMRHYKVVAYGIGDGLKAQYLLRYVSNADVSLGVPTMIEKWAEAADENGDSYTVLEGYNYTGKVRYSLSVDATQQYSDIIRGLKRGEILNIKTGSNGVVEVIEKIYDAASGELTNEWYDGDGAYDREFFKAKLSHYDDTCMEYVYENTDGTALKRVAKHNAAKVYIMSESRNKIISASIKELRTIKHDGIDCADVLMVHQQQLLPKVIFVYRP